MEVNTIIFDMYGVIIKERTGNFIPYIYHKLGEENHERINKLIYDEKLFTKAGYGEISSSHLFSELGFNDPEAAMREYIENYLTIDKDFFVFAEKHHTKYDFVLLSTDVSEWSQYITEYYNLNKFFKHKIVSGDVHLRKPDKAIYELALKIVCKSASECVFIDDSIANLKSASELSIDTIHFNRFGEIYDGKSTKSFLELQDIIL